MALGGAIHVPWVMVKPLRRVIEETIMHALEFHQWNRIRTANALEISPRGLRDHIKRMRRLGYEVPDNPRPKGINAIMVELREYRAGLRKAPEATEYCPTCGKLLK